MSTILQKGNPFAGCGWPSICSTVLNGSLYCCDKATVLLLYNQSNKKKKKEEKKTHESYLKSFDSCGLRTSNAGNNGGQRPRGSLVWRSILQRTAAPSGPAGCWELWELTGSVCSAESTAVKTWNDVSDTQ